jgi:hypothetical protein
MNKILSAGLVLLLCSCDNGYRDKYVIKCTREEKVVKVGPCNKEGRCGFLSEKGESLVAYLPVEGGNVCVERHGEWVREKRKQ